MLLLQDERRLIEAGRRRWAETLIPLKTAAPSSVIQQDLPGCDAYRSRKRRLADVPQSTQYPRIHRDAAFLDVSHFVERYAAHTARGEELGSAICTIRGRVSSVRAVSSSMIFYDITHQFHKIQVMASLQSSGLNKQEFIDLKHLIQKGDAAEFTGIPCRTSAGELTLRVTQRWSLLAPCLHPIPLEIKDSDKVLRNRHYSLRLDPGSVAALRTRARIVSYCRSFFDNRDFVEVETPVLSDRAGGALARPFVTQSTCMPNSGLALRIAPELWLKRLVIGGFDKVYEIGKCFRNEAIDPTHNPEFTTLEAYQAFSGLDDLIETIEVLLSGLAKTLNLCTMEFATPFKRLDFVKEIETAAKLVLPTLNPGLASTDDLVEYYKAVGQELPSGPITVIKLLDNLADTYLVPQCDRPTFIVNHPEVMSPLAKSSGAISHRCELYIRQMEICNAYEEENSPTRQLDKFKMQNSNFEVSEYDKTFVEALEYGLPPTGGLGIGIDRLCMIFTGMNRIQKVLSFGGLRTSVGQGVARKSSNSIQLSDPYKKELQGV